TLLGMRTNYDVPWPAALTRDAVKHLDIKAAVLAKEVRTPEGIDLVSRSSAGSPADREPAGSSPAVKERWTACGFDSSGEGASPDEARVNRSSDRSDSRSERPQCARPATATDASLSARSKTVPIRRATSADRHRAAMTVSVSCQAGSPQTTG